MRLELVMTEPQSAGTLGKGAMAAILLAALAPSIFLAELFTLPLPPSVSMAACAATASSRLVYVNGSHGTDDLIELHASSNIFLGERRWSWGGGAIHSDSDSDWGVGDYDFFFFHLESATDIAVGDVVGGCLGPANRP